MQIKSFSNKLQVAKRKSGPQSSFKQDFIIGIKSFKLYNINGNDNNLKHLAMVKAK